LKKNIIIITTKNILQGGEDMIIRIPKGTQDILPEDIEKWNYVEKIIKEVANRFGYREIRTPIFEYTELFARGIGESTDIVTKEMFTFLDRKERSLTLRPEGTAPVVRAYLEQRMDRLFPVTKLFYLGPMFRSEKPQAGRFRQFHQYGAEIIGTSSAQVDAEIILLCLEIFRKLGLKNLEVLLNSVGCKKCRALYLRELKSSIHQEIDNLCTDCKKRYYKNPLRILDCKNVSCQSIIKKVPALTQYLCEECQEHFQEVQKYLKVLNIEYRLDPRLVRGFDYYTKTAFEIICKELGAQNAVSGGGRYDYLVEEFGGKPTPAVGFAAGIERTILAMQQQKIEWPKDSGIEVFVAKINQEKELFAFELLQKIRMAGISAEMDYSFRSLKGQMRLADKLKARYTIILGEEELSRDRILLRNMQTKEQKEVEIEKIINELKTVFNKF